MYSRSTTECGYKDYVLCFNHVENIVKFTIALINFIQANCLKRAQQSNEPKVYRRRQMDVNAREVMHLHYSEVIDIQIRHSYNQVNGYTERREHRDD